MRPETRAAENRRAVRRWAGVLAAVVAGGVAVVVALRSVFSPEPLLVEARTLLDPAAEEKDPENQAAAGQAELLLRKYLKRGGQHRDSARLLLGCAVLVQQAGSQARTIQDQKGVGDLVDTVDPEQCPVEDLLLGTRVLSKAGHLASADRMIAAALAKAELRDQALRLAIEIWVLLGRDDEVLECCRELNALCPGDPYPLVTIKQHFDRHRRLLDLKVKLYELERRAARDPNNALILAGLVKLYTELGWPERAKFWRRVSQR